MARTYTTTNLIQLPRLSAREALVLAAQVETAFNAAKADSKPKALPAPVTRSMARLKDAASPLAAVLAPQSEGDTQAKRKADRGVDAAWAAFYSWLNGWCQLPEPKNPHLAKATALQDLVFAGGLDFTQMKYKVEWHESETRLQAIDREGHGDVVKKLGGAVFLEHIREAHKAYGKVLHITDPLPERGDVDIRSKLLATLDALRDYATRAAAVADPDEPGSDELSERLLRPIAAWESPAAGSAGSEPESEAPPAPAESENPK